MRRRTVTFILAVLLGIAILPAADAAESRRYRVTFRGEVAGTAVLSTYDDPDGVTTFTHHSRLHSTREDTQADRILHEEVRVRDGVFLSAWSVRLTGDERQAVSAWWAPDSGAVMVRRGARLERVPAGDTAGVETLFDAPRRLIESGAAGARRRVFDLPDGRVGWVVLEQPRDAEGWATTVELGVRVKSRWAPGGRLPDALILPDVGLAYEAVGIEMGADDSGRADHTGVAVGVVGALTAGARVRLVPKEAWPGLSCAGEVVTLTESGPVCPASTEGGETARAGAAVGPRTQRLARQVGEGTPMERAARLARLVDRRLANRAEGAGLWEADAEAALGRSAGDCNEAAAVFVAAAPLARLRVRRRSGLAGDKRDPTRLHPHAWVEIHDGKSWVRVDPSRGEAPATGVYLDLGDGDTVAGRLRAVAPALRSARVEVVPTEEKSP